MAIIPWRKREHGEGVPEIFSLQKHINDLFNSFFEGGDLWKPFSKKWGPHVDVSETADEVVVKAEIPGVNPKNLDVSLSEDLLTIKGEKREEEKKEGENYFRMERSYGSFSRSIQLPATVDLERVKATGKDGVVTIKLKKKEESKGRKIEITSED